MERKAPLLKPLKNEGNKKKGEKDVQALCPILEAYQINMKNREFDEEIFNSLQSAEIDDGSQACEIERKARGEKIKSTTDY